MSAQLPDGWEMVKLNDIVITPKKAIFQLEEEIEYIDINSINNKNQIITGTKKLLWKDAPSRAQQLVSKNAILFSTVRTYLKNIAQITRSGGNLVASTGFCVLETGLPELNTLLLHYVQTRTFLEPLNELQRGTSYPAVRNKDVLSQTIPLPPLNEQRRIVAKLEALFSEVDAAVAQLQAVRQQLTVYRQAVLQAAFAGKLTAAWRAQQPQLPTAAELLADIHTQRAAQAQATGKKLKPVAPLTTAELADLPELPEGWAWVRLGDYTLDVTDGDHQPPPKSEHGVPFITISCIDDGRIDFSKAFSVPEEYYAKLLPNRRPQKGDILYTVTGSYGVTVLVNFEESFCFQRHIGLIRPMAQSNRHYLKYFLDSPFAKAQAESGATGTAQKTVSLKNLRNFTIPLADQIEQAQIVLEIESRLSVADKLAEAVETSLRQAEVLRQSLLHRAFQGQLVPQDPTDEPASALLARIRAERSEQPVKRGRKKQEVAL
jgi:type I restriction enzyme, S subunit